jgi:hypothetical protein
MCVAFGCFRDQIPTDGECVDDCNDAYGTSSGDEYEAKLIIPYTGVLLNGKPVSEQYMHSLKLGDTITTLPIEGKNDRNYAVIQYGDGIWVKLAPGSKAEIGHNGISLIRGNEWIGIHKRMLKPPGFLTLNARTSARGTEFEIETDDFGTTVYVYEGEVDVSDIDDLLTVTVSANQMTDVPDGWIPSDPVDFNAASTDQWWNDVPETPASPADATSTDSGSSDGDDGGGAGCFLNMVRHTLAF